VEWINETRIPFDPISEKARISYPTGSGFLCEKLKTSRISEDRIFFSVVYVENIPPKILRRTPG
jgi:hypothetical protein